MIIISILSLSRCNLSIIGFDSLHSNYRSIANSLSILLFASLYALLLYYSHHSFLCFATNSLLYMEYSQIVSRLSSYTYGCYPVGSALLSLNCSSSVEIYFTLVISRCSPILCYIHISGSIMYLSQFALTVVYLSNLKSL